MKPTVQQGITRRAVSLINSHPEIFNKEVIPVLLSCRDALNFRSVYKARTNTADSLGAYKTIWESEQVADNTAGLIDVTIVGTTEDGFYCAYRKVTLYIVSGGALGLAGAATVYSIETDAALDGRINLLGVPRLIQVQGMDNGTAADFTAVVEVLEITR